MPNQVPYGFHRLADLRDRRVIEVGVDRVDTAITQSIEEHNRNLNQMFDVLVYRTTDFKTVYGAVASARTQPLDEDGRARKIKSALKYEVGFPLNMWGLAWGGNWITLEKMTVGEAAEQTQTLMSADMRRLRDEMLIALFQNADYTYFDDLRGNITVKPLANNDSQVYNVMVGADAGGTDSHLLGQAGANLTAASFTALNDELTEHPENPGDVTVWIPSSQRAAVEAIGGFLPIADSNVQLGSGSNRLVGTDGLAGPGVLFGYVNKCFVREWRQMPSGYAIAMTTGGNKPLAMREDPEASLRGFKKVAERADHPFYEDQYVRRAGFGAYNRVGAAVLRLGNATYAVPAGFTRGS